MSEKLRSADAVEMGIDKHVVASLDLGIMLIPPDAWIYYPLAA